MSGDVLLEALPDLVLLVRRNGIVLAAGGGQGVAIAIAPEHAAGQSLEALWPESTAALLRQLVRKAVAQRGTAEARFQNGGHTYEARAAARGPDKALCIIRALPSTSAEDSLDTTGDRLRPELDRRGFLKRFKESISVAALREEPLAVAVIHLDGVADIARALGTRISEHIMSAAILRLSAQRDGRGTASPDWYLGQLSEGLLAVVVKSADRDAIELCISQVCASLREPVAMGDAQFHLTPYAGVGILGQDASSPRVLLDNARAAAAEARRDATGRVFFFSDTLKLKSLARLDIARELRDAIANRDIRLRYVGRHDLSTGRLVTRVAYLRWVHPLRGEIRPAEFLRVAETTGLAPALSRAVLACLRDDYLAFVSGAPASDAGVRISFGALRHHVLHEDFVDDIERFLDEGAVAAERLELRIAEKAFVARAPTDLTALARRGVRLVVDEVAREMACFHRLARAPIWGLQLDRAWVTALRTDDVARKVCRAGIAVARALDLVAIATGVDSQAQRDALLTLGCRYGTGDFYARNESDIRERSAVQAAG